MSSKYFPNYGITDYTQLKIQSNQNLIKSGGSSSGTAGYVKQNLSTLPATLSAVNKNSPRSQSDLALNAISGLVQASIAFAYSNPSLTTIEKRYKFKTISDMKTIQKGMRKKKNDLNAAILPYQKGLLKNKDTELDLAAKIASLDNMLGVISEIIALKEFESGQKEADEKAIERGYKDAEDALAIREVEIEWYFKLYGIQDPIAILAYQKIEKAKYGMTSYEAALNGTQLVEPASPEVEANRQAAEAEEEQIASDIIAAEEADEKKKKMIYGGLALGGLAIAGLLFMRKK